MIIITVKYSGSSNSYDIYIDTKISLREFFAISEIKEPISFFNLYRVSPAGEKTLLDPIKTLSEAGIMNGDTLLIEKAHGEL